jgi:ribosomal protein S18 acetylase RimI-like enzyme
VHTTLVAQPSQTLPCRFPCPKNHTHSQGTIMSSTTPSQTTIIQQATTTDLPAITTLVSLAYSPYLSRLDGKLPAPMTADYVALIASSSLYTLITDGEVVGCISLSLTTPSSTASYANATPSSSSSTTALEINNLAIHPASQGKGYGKLLLRFAEAVAKDKGLGSCCLYTNVKMIENVALYGRLGYKETGRFSQDGFERVGFVKVLG